MNIQPTQKRKPRGFSLVELLVTIAVIGVLASLSIASMSGVSGIARKTTAQGQAQRIASMFQSGLAAGAPAFTAADGVDEAMNAVGTGANGAGTFSTSNFRLPGISSTMDDAKPAEEQAKTYLSWNGTLVYNASGSGGSSGGDTGGGGPSGPPEGWTAMSSQDMASLMSSAQFNTQNSSLTLQQAVDWYNSQPSVPVTLMVQDGQVYYQQSTPPSGGGYSSQI